MSNVLLNTQVRWMCVALPILLTAAAVFRLPLATAETTGNCPSIVGSYACGTHCYRADKVYAKPECATSTDDGCCKYLAYNIHCGSDIPYAPSQCPNKYIMELYGTSSNSRCVDAGGEVKCVENNNGEIEYGGGTIR